MISFLFDSIYTIQKPKAKVPRQVSRRNLDLAKGHSTFKEKVGHFSSHFFFFFRKNIIFHFISQILNFSLEGKLEELQEQNNFVSLREHTSSASSRQSDTVSSSNSNILQKLGKLPKLHQGTILSKRKTVRERQRCSTEAIFCSHQGIAPRFNF